MKHESQWNLVIIKTIILREKKKMLMIAFHVSIIEINASDQCDFLYIGLSYRLHQFDNPITFRD